MYWAPHNILIYLFKIYSSFLPNLENLAIKNFKDTIDQCFKNYASFPPNLALKPATHNTVTKSLNICHAPFHPTKLYSLLSLLCEELSLHRGQLFTPVDKFKLLTNVNKQLKSAEEEFGQSLWLPLAS